ncbi:MAG: 5-methylcytosine-specific restriction enzyme [Bacteroidota bacterium]|jgi:5-methylcytosine-specific restriction protein B
MIVFKDILELTDKINKDLGPFCNEVLYARKAYVGAKRVGTANRLFYVEERSKDRPWAINAGGGTEIQYHVAFNPENKDFYYGLGLNAQYVPHNNDLSPIEYIEPFAQAFIKLFDEIKEILPDYDLLIGEFSGLFDIQLNDYFLFGKSSPLIVEGDKFSIKEEDYNEMLRDLKRQFQVYKMIFEEKLNSAPVITVNLPNDINNNSKNMELNTILYGPPGTGKTYTTINLALEICGINSKDLNREEAKQKFEEFTQQGRIVFTTFHQSMSYEDFIEGIKPVEPEKEGDQVIYRVEDGIFKKLCVEAAFSIATESESKQTETVLDFSLAYDELVNDIIERFNEDKEYELDSKNGGKVLVDNISANGNIMIKHHGGTRTYTVSKKRSFRLHDSIADLDSVNNIHDQFRAIIGGSNSSAYWSVLNAIQKKLNNKTPQKKTDRKYEYEEMKGVIQTLRNVDFKNKSGKPFILVIDEINRGNVSQIFGELITLIEDDKRLGKDEAIQVTLPYSKDEKFGVPSNLYIIGTMNTADRSVEALDTALRRRFSFEEMPPKPELLNTTDELKNAGIDLEELLTIMNNRIEKLIDRDHRIGHSYFINVKNFEQLKSTFHNKIIPLLQEYFFGDHGKIGLVLGKGFVSETVNSIDDDFFADFDYDTDGLMQRKVYQLQNVSKLSIEEFIVNVKAIKKN